MNLISTPHPYTHLELKPTAHMVKKDVVRALMCVGLGLGPNALIALISTVVAAVKAIFYAIASLHYYVAMTQHEDALARLKEKITDLTFSQEERTAALQEHQNSQLQLMHRHFELKRSLAELHDNGRKIVASFLLAMPIAGVFAAGSFLARRSPQPVEGTPTLKQIWKAAKEYFAYDFKSLGDYLLFPLGQNEASLADYYGDEEDIRHEFDNHIMKPSEKMLYLGARETPVAVDRGDGLEHTLRCQLIKTTGNSPDKMMLLFHPATTVAEEMAQAALFYKNAGWNVMLVTLGGFPGSDEEVSTSEVTLIQDVHAALAYLQNLGVQHNGVYGPSVRGSAAAAVAMDLSDKVIFADLEDPIDSPAGMISNLIDNCGAIGKMLPKGLAKALMRVSCPAGVEVHGVQGRDGRPYKTDGLCNTAKIANYKGVLVVRGSAYDYTRGVDYDEEHHCYHSILAERLYDAYCEHQNADNADLIIERCVDFKGVDVEHIEGRYIAPETAAMLYRRVIQVEESS